MTRVWEQKATENDEKKVEYMLHKEARGGRLSIKFRGTRNFINKLFRRAKRGE